MEEKTMPKKYIQFTNNKEHWWTTLTPKGQTITNTNQTDKLKHNESPKVWSLIDERDKIAHRQNVLKVRERNKFTYIDRMC